MEAINKGAKVVNLSLGSYADSPMLRDLIADANKREVLILAAKGNSPVADLVFPAAYDGVIAVTAVDGKGNVAAYANRADIPTVGAPGSTVVHLNGNTFVTSGTSVSTAVVSGVSAGYMETSGKNATETGAHIRDELSVGTSRKK